MALRIVGLGSSGCCNLANGWEDSINQDGITLMLLEACYGSTIQVRMSERWVEVQDGWTRL